MYYTVYKISNLINGKIYIGIHKTNNLNDEYYGSGINIKRAINKYGLENFSKEYIAIFNNQDDMYNMESELVNEDLLKSNNTYNITKGGNGGWYYVNDLMDDNTRHNIAVRGGKESLRKNNRTGSDLRKCVPPEVRINQARQMGVNFGGSNRLSDKNINERLVLLANIDMTKYGWVEKASKILYLTHTQVRRFISKYYVGSYYRRSCSSNGKE